MKTNMRVMMLGAAMAAALGAMPAVAGPATVAPPSAPATQPPVAGGWTPMSRHAPELRAVVRAAVGRIGAGPPAGVMTAERQVVAGTNYRLLLMLADGSHWRVVVWQRLDGRLEVTSAERAH